MAKTAILAIRIIGDATAAVAALDKVDGSAKSMQASMGKAAAGAAVALAAVAGVLKVTGDAASELEQAVGAVDSVFEGYAGRVHKFAESAADDVGLSAEQYSQMAAVLGSQLKNMGVDMDDATDKSSALIKTGADLAATFGGSTADAVGAVSSLLRGERDPIERYGVSLKQADIDARKMALGLDKLTGEADKAATTQATLQLLTEQTSAATGKFAAEADTAAGMQARANAQWIDAQAALGEQLLPYMVEGARLLADMAMWAGENVETTTTLVGVIAALAGGILILNGALKAYELAQGLATIATWASNAAWLANPVTWVILAIVLAVGLLIAVILLVIKYWDELAAGGAYAWAVIVEGIEDVFNWMVKLADWAIPDWLEALLGIEQFKGSIDLSGGPVEMFGSGAMAPLLAAATPAPGLSSSFAQQPSGATFVSNYNTTVNGALDPNSVAKQIDGLMTSNRRSSGALVAGGATW